MYYCSKCGAMMPEDCTCRRSTTESRFLSITVNNCGHKWFASSAGLSVSGDSPQEAFDAILVIIETAKEILSNKIAVSLIKSLAQENKIAAIKAIRDCTEDFGLKNSKRIMNIILGE